MRIKFIDELSENKRVFTFEDIINKYNVNRNVLSVILNRLGKKGWIKRIGKGKFLIIPLGFNKENYTINEFLLISSFIKNYTIAYWSALHYYNYTEQFSNVVFVQTIDRKKHSTFNILDINYKIIRVNEKKFWGIEQIKIDGTNINITSKEKTILDCLDKPAYCGGIIEVVKALKSREYNKKKLFQYAKKYPNTSVIRRLGYLCEILSIKHTLPTLKTRNYLFLDPSIEKSIKSIKKYNKNTKWKLLLNINEDELVNNND